jgi:protein-S-isoprenylcysteine O-methyltransferase Ste14
MPYLKLVLLWIAWCALHSAMITPAVTDALRKRYPAGVRYYRLLYNLIAIATLVPVVLYSESFRGQAIVSWEGPLVIVPMLLGAAALLFFLAGGRRYDFLQFSGIRQVRAENDCNVLTDNCALDTSGILSVVRHPWYTGGILIVWARPLDAAALVTNLVLCGYFVVGALLEERKLIQQFGQQYADYQQRVSMFFPIKWIAAKRH